MSDALSETIVAVGHENVSGEHASTLEVTSDDFLTPAGDCILGIEADTVPAEFSDEFVAACQDGGATVTIDLETANSQERIVARGDPELTFASERSAVIRTSGYVDERTVAVGADTAAADVDRALVSALAEGEQLRVTLAVDREES